MQTHHEQKQTSTLESYKEITAPPLRELCAPPVNVSAEKTSQGYSAVSNENLSPSLLVLLKRQHVTVRLFT